MATTWKKNILYEHQSNSLTNVTIRIGDNDYLASMSIRPATATIYNVSTADANWTAVATGLTNVLSWRLSDKSGADFYFAFEATGATYATAFGWVGEQSSISAVYVKRTGTVNVDAQLVVWTA